MYYMKKVLIVEDESKLRDAYSFLLKKHGYTPSEAANGKEALAQVEKNKPDVILLDLRMPIMNGLEFLRNLSNYKEKPTVIIFSNYDIKDEIDEAYKLGARRYILKAWASPQDLLKVINEATDKSSINL